MDRNMFWDVIDSTNAAGPYPDQETWRCRMTAALEKHTMEEILDWQLILEEYMQSAAGRIFWPQPLPGACPA